MAFAFNPFTGNFDLKGSGGGGGASYIDGEVATYTDLPLDGSAALNTAWLVREASGTWLIARKPAGIYIRTATAGVSRDADWTYAGILPDVFNDANFLLYDDADSSKNLAFQLSGITTGTTRTVDAPAGNGRMLVEGQSIGSTTAAAGTFTTLTANNGTLTASAPVLDLAQTWNASGTTFTGIRANFTNTASATASRLMDLQIGGTSTFYVERNGTIVGNVANAQTLLTAAVNFVAFDVAASGGGRIRFAGGGLGSQPMLFWASNGLYRFGPDATAGTTTTGFWLSAEGTSNVLALRNDSNAQESRLYSTFTSSTNYQRMTIKSVRQTLSALNGASATTTGTFIPDGAVVVGVTTRVSTLLAGATGYTIGDGTDADRWGDITGTAVGTTSDNRDWTAGTIECFTAGGNITLTAVGSNFTAGAIEISVFYLAGEAD
jgi:hypothetical protein